MSDNHSTKNYFASGGDELVIGGKLTILPGAEVLGADGLPRPCLIWKTARLLLPPHSGKISISFWRQSAPPD